MVPETIKLGPVLPYSTSAIGFFELHNPMEDPIEVYSVDFDKQFIDEEDILKRTDNFGPNGTAEPMFLALRKPGGDFWPAIRQQDEKKRAIESLRGQIKNTEDQLNECL